MKTNSMYSTAYVALFAALFVVFSFIKLKFGFSPVPITLQTLAVVLAGLFLKPKQAFLSILIVCIIGIIGLPVFGGKGGIPHLLGPTGGFIVYFPFGALLLSYFTDFAFRENRLASNRLLRMLYLFIVFYVFGSVASFFIGIPWFMLSLDYSLHEALAVAYIPFIFGDLLKTIVAVIIAMTLERLVRKTRIMTNQ